jgi:hypothetical protein
MTMNVSFLGPEQEGDVWSSAGELRDARWAIHEGMQRLSERLLGVSGELRHVAEMAASCTRFAGARPPSLSGRIEAATISFAPLSLNEAETSDHIFVYPDSKSLAACLAQIPLTNGPYYAEKGILGAAAKYFANQEKVGLGIEIGVHEVLEDLNAKLRLREETLAAIHLNIVEALKRCAS